MSFCFEHSLDAFHHPPLLLLLLFSFLKHENRLLRFQVAYLSAVLHRSLRPTILGLLEIARPVGEVGCHLDMLQFIVDAVLASIEGEMRVVQSRAVRGLGWWCHRLDRLWNFSRRALL